MPQTIEVIPRATIEQQGVTTLSEALRNVPGITLQAGEGGGASNTAGDMFNMRGFNASNSLFVDGVRDDGLVSRDVFNLEQVEVFLGPTGSDVGRGTAAGYVNMQTKTPHLGSRERRDVRATAAPTSGRVTADLNFARSRAIADSWLGKSRGSPERAVAGQRRPGPRRGRARRAGDRAVARASASARRHASTARRAVPAPGQPAGLRHSRRGLAGRAARRRRRSSADAGRSEQLLRQPGYDYDHATQDSYTARVEHDVTATLHAAQPDPLQPDPPRRGHHAPSRTRRPTTPRPNLVTHRASGQRVARTRSRRTRPA